MGAVEVPRDALWRAQTQRAIENFPISGLTLQPRHVQALAHVKAAAATANAALGVVRHEQAQAIVTAADAIVAGTHDGEFPLDVFQTWSGTSSYMNANEVIATLAGVRRGSVVRSPRLLPTAHPAGSGSSARTCDTPPRGGPASGRTRCVGRPGTPRSAGWHPAWNGRRDRWSTRA